MADSGPHGRIFISYRRQDAAYAAGWLYDRLRNQFGSAEIFKDVDNLEPGDDFVDKITAAVSSCDVLLALIGPDWVRITDEHGKPRLQDPEDFVRLEIEVALTRAVRVIPLLVEDARMPRGELLPDSLRPLTRKQALELSPSRFNRDTDELLDLLERVLTEAADAPASVAAASAGVRASPQPQVHVERAVRPADPVPESPAIDEPAEPEPFWEVPSAVGALGGVSQGTEQARQDRQPRDRRARRRVVWVVVGIAALAVLIVPGILFARDLPGLNNGPSQTTQSASVLPQSAASLDDDVIVWRRVIGKSANIASMRVNGADEKTLSPTGKGYNSVVISHDRRTVLYRQIIGKDANALHAMAADGSGDKVLFEDGDGNCPVLTRPAWSKANRLAMVCNGHTSGGSALVTMDLEGTQVKILARGEMGDPTFTADGTMIVYWRGKAVDDGGSLYAVPVDGKSLPRRLTQASGRIDGDPACAPTGDLVAFRRKVNGVGHIYTVDVNQGLAQEPKKLTSGASNDDRDPSWSPNGDQIVFRRGPDKQSRLFVMGADGSNPKPIPHEAGVVDQAVTWSTR
jgi:hypothetical protein